MTRIVSGSFAILSGTMAGVLSGIHYEGVKSNERIVGFASNSNFEVLVMYKL